MKKQLTNNMTLTEIKQNLNSFQLIQCGLSHEAVQLDSKTNLPIMTGAIDKQFYKRVALCNLKDRKQRLGCAHSSANDKFNKLIDRLPENDEVIKKLKKEFNDVVLQIYMLDHKKGDLEKKYAELLVLCDSSILTSSGIQKEFDSCKLTHKKYINQLSYIKSGIIERIDEMISS